jgi:hypothetical protein
MAYSEPNRAASAATVSAAASFTAAAVPQCWSSKVASLHLHSGRADLVHSMSLPEPLAVHVTQQDYRSAVRLC